VKRLILAASFAVTACATVIPAGGPVTLSPSTTLSSWEVEMAQATRRSEPYEWTMRQADLRATLITPRLRRAFLDEREKFHGKFADKTHTELVGLGEPDEGVDGAKVLSGPAGEEQVLVFVAMYAADQKNRDLSASYTIWDTQLSRGANKVRPLSIENVRASPAVSDVFPYVDRFDDLYLFRFPLVEASSGTAVLADGPEPLRLEVRSAVADCVVSWDLKD